MSRAQGWWRRSALALAMALAATLAVTAGAEARDVKRCGITIGPGKTGKLVQDVECGYRCTRDSTVRCKLERDDYRCPIGDGQSCTAETIVLGRNATLDLNGFTLASAYQQDGVICAAGSKSRCTIQGPGNFFARKGKAITPNDRDVILKDLLIDRDYHGFATAGWVRADNVRLTSCSAAMHAAAGIRATNVHVGGGCQLISGRNMYLDNVESVDHIGAFGTIRGRDVIARRSIGGGNVFLTRSRSPWPLDTELGAYEKDVYSQGKLVLRDSIVGGIEAETPPKLVRSSCMQSFKLGTSGDWGVCALD